MQVRNRSIDTLKPYENNPRKNDQAVDALAVSIEKFGFRQPVVVDENGVIICGHTRVKAAKSLGMDKVPVHVAKNLTPEEVRAYRLADNKISDISMWDEPLLAVEVDELQSVGVDVCDLGFTDEELAQLSGEKDVEELFDDEDQSFDEPVVSAEMVIPPLVWMRSESEIRQAFDKLAKKIGAEIRWPS